jgi:magnesium transporter
MTQFQERTQFSEPKIVRLAEKIKEQSEVEALQTLQELPPEVAGEVLEHLDEEVSSRLIAHLRKPQAAEILEEMAPDAAVDIIEGLPDAERAELLRRMEPPEAGVLQTLIAYPPDSAGGLMSPNVVALRKDLTVEQAIATLRRTANEVETIYYAYVVDLDRRLLGVLSMRDLIIRDAHVPLEEVMHRDVVTVTADTDAEEVARLFDRYNFLALPVVDQQGRLLGIVTVDDVIDVIREEATEDMHRLVGLPREESVLSPLRAAIQRRIPWLLVNLSTAFLSALVVAPFGATISAVAILAAFMPIIAGHGGNTGTQVTTLVVRGLALGEVSLRDLWTIVNKEIAFGLVHGVLAGVFTSLLAVVLSQNLWLAVVVFVAMVGNVLIAGIMGSMIPLALKRLGQDPALASAIWLTTFTDICGFLMLLGLGTVFISHLRH